MENKFNKPEELIEWIAVTHGVILAFAQRGYGLYKLGRGPMMFSDIEMIMEFVQYGRAEDVLEIGYRYLPLPLLEDSKDHFQMRKAYEEMILQLRGPFFIDIGTNSAGNPEALGKHLIDTIGVYPPFLHIGTDVKFAQITSENTIVLHLSNAAQIIMKQVMMSLRQVNIQQSAKKPNALL
jgi:hypothetical protein